MLESVYNIVLFVLAIVGALRAGAWIVGRGWRWYWKAVALVAVAAAVLGFAGQIGGGPKSDLRIVTEILATAGTVFALELGFRRVRDDRARFAFVAVAGLFLFVTWTESVDRAMGTVKTVAPPSISAPVQGTPSTRSQGGVDPMCADPATTYEQRQILRCP
ncbi:hypothetical protein HY630_01775 [Candidatus Uhrbacteria bacterium]|nr:hypothetical protein [Candidatus Uhrbacteria bacterium]